MTASPFVTASVRCARTFARDSRGGVAIGLAFGAFALISISLVGFDLYSRIKADVTVARMAATMADYVSRETAPEGVQITALGRFLHEQELRVPADVVYVISVIRKPADDDPATVSWVDTVQLGDATATAEVVDSCGRFGAAGGTATLPDDFTMEENDVVVIAEVCARLRREGSLTSRFIDVDLYRLLALPARNSDLASARPTRPEPEDTT